jgi:hypothetical protein
MKKNEKNVIKKKVFGRTKSLRTSRAAKIKLKAKRTGKEMRKWRTELAIRRL